MNQILFTSRNLVISFMIHLDGLMVQPINEVIQSLCIFLCPYLMRYSHLFLSVGAIFLDTSSSLNIVYLSNLFKSLVLQHQIRATSLRPTLLSTSILDIVC